jgi:hypothetical protein
LPTFGRPAKHAKPHLKPGWADRAGWAGSAAEGGVCGDPTS